MSYTKPRSTVDTRSVFCAYIRGDVRATFALVGSVTANDALGDLPSLDPLLPATYCVSCAAPPSATLLVTALSSPDLPWTTVPFSTLGFPTLASMALLG